MGSRVKEGRKIYRAQATIGMPQKVLVEVLQDLDNATSWNNTLVVSRIVRRIGENVTLSYQVSTTAAGGVVSAREFVVISQHKWIGDVFVMGGKGVECDEVEHDPKLVKAVVGPGCNMVAPVDDTSCRLTWLMDCQYGGMMPQAVLDIALPTAQTQWIKCVENLAKKMKKEGKF